MSEPMPGYWMNETSGKLRPVVEAYLKDEPLTASDIGILRVYLRQWITAPRFRGVDDLRKSVDEIATRADLDRWIFRATDVGCDPL